MHELLSADRRLARKRPVGHKTIADECILNSVDLIGVRTTLDIMHFEYSVKALRLPQTLDFAESHKNIKPRKVASPTTQGITHNPLDIWGTAWKVIWLRGQLASQEFLS